MNHFVRMKKQIKTHLPIYKQLADAVSSIKLKIRNKVNRHEVEDCIRSYSDCILEDLQQFDLGRHILLTGGANGKWTDYMISPLEHLSTENLEKGTTSMLESFLLFHSPIVLAQRELMELIRKKAQEFVANVKDDIALASIPCGVMRDLLSLKFPNPEKVSLFGIDLDPEALKIAKELSKSLHIHNVTFMAKDAWCLGYQNTFDFISSIGLNVYEPNKEAVVDLYRQFYKSLKPGGILCTGVLTWPPFFNEKKSEWKVEEIGDCELYFEALLHKDIIDSKWMNFRMLSEIEDEFKLAGFSDVEIVQDSRSIFPAVFAIKSTK